jgi:hypothetical protein
MRRQHSIADMHISYRQESRPHEEKRKVDILRLSFNAHPKVCEKFIPGRSVLDGVLYLC